MRHSLLTLFQNNSLLKNTISIILPTSCCVCGVSHTDLICTACRLDYFSRPCKRCHQCAISIPSSSNTPYCGQCLQNQPAFDASLTVCDYAAPTDQLVLALKFGHHLPLAKLLADAMVEQVLSQVNFDFPDLFCPVPLSKQRLAERGFNQSLEIAKIMSSQLQIPLAMDLLIRTKNTPPQSSLAHEFRIKNVRNAFIIRPDMIDSVAGKHIGIVDDVLTTGATVNELAKLLKRFGARKVSNLLFARTTQNIL
jgi:ComF family protein